MTRMQRESAIVTAINKLVLRGKYKMFTRGEICRVMGITSQSKIRDILRGMADCGRLVCATTALDGYADEVEIFGLPSEMVQTPLPDNHIITINGVSMKMTGEVL